MMTMMMNRRSVYLELVQPGLRVALVLVLVLGMGGVGFAGWAEPAGVVEGMDQPFLMVDRRLNESVIDFETIGEGTLVFRDRLGAVRRQSARSVLALIRQKGVGDIAGEGRREVEWSGPVLTLTDGRVFTGRLLEVREVDEEVIWRNDFLGLVVAPLETVRRMYFRPSVGEEESPIDRGDEGDVVELVNGDRLVGFIASIGRKQLVMELDGGNEVEVEMARVAWLNFANEAVSAAEDACWVWIDDGSIVEVEAEELLVRDGALRMVLAGQSEERWISFTSVDAVVYGVGGLRGLAGLKVLEDTEGDQGGGGGYSWFGTPVSAVIEGSGSVAWSRDLPCGLGDILYSGPGEVRYELPAGVVRFAAGVEIPRWALDWGDFELVILVDGAERYREHFDGVDSSGRLVFDFEENAVGGQARELAIRLEEGGHGPIQDTVRLVRPMLLIAN